MVDFYSANGLTCASVFIRRMPMFDFEHKGKPLLDARGYRLRLLYHLLMTVALLASSLALGMCGYHGLEGLSWLDALVDSSMLLGGMGPVHPIVTDAGKLFVSFYALFSGLIFLVAAGVGFAPVFHRLLHKFHLDAEEGRGDRT
jgi:hypothetical protein